MPRALLRLFDGVSHLAGSDVDLVRSLRQDRRTQLNSGDQGSGPRPGARVLYGRCCDHDLSTCLSRT